MKNKSIGKVQSKRSKKRWNVKMDHKKLALIFLLILIPLLVMSLHLLSESVYFGVTERDFLGINVSLNLVYDVVLYLIIFIPIICILLFLMGNKKKVQKH